MKFILANSCSIKRQLINDENVAKEKVKVIYNSVKIRKIKNLIFVIYLKIFDSVIFLHTYSGLSPSTRGCQENKLNLL